MDKDTADANNAEAAAEPEATPDAKPADDDEKHEGSIKEEEKKTKDP